MNQRINMMDRQQSAYYKGYREEISKELFTVSRTNILAFIIGWNGNTKVNGKIH